MPTRPDRHITLGMVHRTTRRLTIYQSRVQLLRQLRPRLNPLITALNIPCVLDHFSPKTEVSTSRWRGRCLGAIELPCASMGDLNPAERSQKGHLVCKSVAPVYPAEPGYNEATWLPGIGTAVFVPENFEPAYRYPVVVWLEESASSFEARTWFPLISSRNAVVISLQPDRSCPKGQPDSSLREWFSFEYVRRSAAEVAKEILIHPHRIFLAGRATGAAMAHDLSRAKPGCFAGAILIDPRAASLPPRRSTQRFPAPVATKRNLEVHLHQRCCCALPKARTISDLSKQVLARGINQWLIGLLKTQTP